MDILKRLILVLTCLTLISCAKVSYLTEQGIGQFKILYDAKENNELLNDPKVKKEYKEKIMLIEKYKAFFYEYWSKSSTDIYSKTTILDRDAVTYLVITSPKDKVYAIEECFIFAGCFPYLGFFKKSSALDYVKKMEEQGNETYMRKVLAYSTLNKFSDPILSTFFLYDRFELAETIFHELFHTILFIKDEVDLNENLANFFGKKLLEIYFANNKDNIKLKKYFEMEKAFRELSSFISNLGIDYEKSLTIDASDKAKKNFLDEIFTPKIKDECVRLKLQDHCWPLRATWNNATFAAFKTYEKGQDKIAKMLNTHGGDLKELFKYIEKKYLEYDEGKKEMSFENYLLQ